MSIESSNVTAEFLCTIFHWIGCIYRYTTWKNNFALNLKTSFSTDVLKIMSLIWSRFWDVITFGRSTFLKCFTKSRKISEKCKFYLDHSVILRKWKGLWKKGHLRRILLEIVMYMFFFTVIHPNRLVYSILGEKCKNKCVQILLSILLLVTRLSVIWFWRLLYRLVWNSLFSFSLFYNKMINFRVSALCLSYKCIHDTYPKQQCVSTLALLGL